MRVFDSKGVGALMRRHPKATAEETKRGSVIRGKLRDWEGG